MENGYYKLSWRQRIGFSAGDLAQNLIYQTVSIWLLFFYTNVYGLKPSVSAVMFLVVRIIDVIWDPIVGAFVDKANPRWGKYRSWLIFAGVPLAGFAMLNTIKIGVESRSREISAMRYIGATNFFMTTPFIIEGIIIGLISAGIGYVLQSTLYNAIYNAMSGEYKMIAVAPFADVQNYILLGFVVIGVVAGMVGSGISLRRYMKV